MSGKRTKADTDNDKRWKTTLRNATDDFEISGTNMVKCRYCDYEVEHRASEGNRNHIRHIGTNEHVQCKSIKLEADRKFNEGEWNKTEMQCKLLEFIVQCNIPFEVVEHPAARSFFDAVGFNLKSRNYYCNNLLEKMATKSRT